MPPHCDTMDGPVVRAAMSALEAGDVTLVLPFVHKEGEEEVIAAFDKVMRARACGDPAGEVADRYFFETVVRIHRAGEGAPYTGLKPAGLGEGLVIPVAERAIETGSADVLIALLAETVRGQLGRRFDEVMHLKEQAPWSVDHARAYVKAMLGLEVYSHGLYEFAKSEPHAAHHEHGAT